MRVGRFHAVAVVLILAIGFGARTARADISVTFDPAQPSVPTGGFAPVVVTFDLGSCGAPPTFFQIFAGHPQSSPFWTLSVVSASSGVSCSSSNDNTSVECTSSVPLDKISVTVDLHVPIGGAGQGSLVAQNSSICGDISVDTTATGFVLAGPHLSINKTAGRNLSESFANSSHVFNHQGFFYSIDVTNNGNADTTGPVTVIDRISSLLAIGGVPKSPSQQPEKPYWYLVPFSESTDCTTSPSGLISCTIPSIPAGKSARVVIFVEVNSATAGPIVNSATVNGGGDSTAPHTTPPLTLVNDVTQSPFVCAEDSTTGCLYSGADSTVQAVEPFTAPAGRFQIRVYWSALKLGTSGAGNFVALTSDTGYFWFFGPNAVELAVKIVDGRGVNGKFWVFYGALTNVDYVLEVVDSETGVVQGYYNPQEHQASFADTSDFPTAASTVQTAGEFEFMPMNFSGASASGEPSKSYSSPQAIPSPCVADATTLCLKGGRFKVKVAWQALKLGTSGSGNAVPLPTDAGTDTGYFWFFGANAVELLCKVVDGTAVNGKFWFFYGALSDVQYTVTVTDTHTGAVKTYMNPQDHLGSEGDTTAF